MTQASKIQQRNRTKAGRYKRGPICDVCAKPAGHDYGSHGDCDGPILHGDLLVICDRVACGKLSNLPAAEALAAVQAIRAKRQ